ncbi:hypothetical protein CXZ10_04475 [Pleomorphomonas diazotrophica]|uniref:Uncharacterized protein n=1 Tax=Pleomorphomonas diazotrophica TaxID=1166257 RepID=A0A1I4QKF6_9HYPH|nr:hypothetical protein [Pleomorphomonas diazotrophica]PKR90622.1 hypothetical protein CXZ10_04475 [Pleomorphomonas diazotrophica]SFM40103.1 hypothetical protein SAMN05192571_101419 [Pleomorphomonas diazotrophica]
MSHLVGLALIGAGIYVVVRVLKREMTRVAEILHEANAQPVRVEIRMERDPVTGVYRERR